MAIHRVGDLEIEQDLAFERRSRLVESTGIWLMVAVVAAASLGLLGQLQHVMPMPVRAESAPDRVIFVVAIAEPGQPLTLTFGMQPARVGLLRGRAGLEGAAPGGVAFRQLVLP